MARPGWLRRDDARVAIAFGVTTVVCTVGALQLPVFTAGGVDWLRYAEMVMWSWLAFTAGQGAGGRDHPRPARVRLQHLHRGDARLAACRR